MNASKSSKWSLLKVSGVVLALVIVAGCSSNSSMVDMAPVSSISAPADAPPQQQQAAGFSLAAGDALGQSLFMSPSGSAAAIAQND